jgi:NIPSNAP
MFYELRTYICIPGRLRAVVERFEHPVLGIFDELGIQTIGFWTNDADGKYELIYLLKWNSEAERADKMGAFLKDSRWLGAKLSSERDGPIIESFSSKTLKPTAFSALR